MPKVQKEAPDKSKKSRNPLRKSKGRTSDKRAINEIANTTLRIIKRTAIVAWEFLQKVINVFIAYIIVPIANLAFMAIPFLHKIVPPVYAYVVWGIALVIFAVNSIYQWKQQRKSNTPRKIDVFTRGFSWVGLVFFSSAFITNYFDTCYTWNWVIAVSAALACPFTWLNMHNLVGMNDKQHSPEQRKRNHFFCWKMIVFYWLVDGFYISIFTRSLVWQFVTGGLCMIIIYVNLSTVVLSNRKIKKIGAVHDLLIGVSLTVYLIYIIPDETLQNVVLVIVGALYGGLMTLVGVAWTIKDGQNREEENKHLENLPFLQLEISHDDVAPLFDMELPLSKDATDTITKVVKMKNVGNGTAANIVYTWKYGQNNIVETNYMPITAVMKGDSYYILFLCDVDENSEEETHAALVFAYSDLLGQEYEQHINVIFKNLNLVRFENDVPR